MYNMKLVGKKIVRNTGGEIAGKSELLVNPVNGTLRVSRQGMKDINLEGKEIGFAYDDDAVLLYIVTEEGSGIAMKESGTFSSRYHARELNEHFKSADNTEKFKLNLDTTVQTFDEFEGINFYGLTQEEPAAVNGSPSEEEEEAPKAKKAKKEEVSIN